MSTEPKRETTFMTSAPFFETVAVPYEFHANPSHIPLAALSGTVIEEWTAWWHWHIDRLAEQAKERLRDETADHRDGL